MASTVKLTMASTERSAKWRDAQIGMPVVCFPGGSWPFDMLFLELFEVRHTARCLDHNCTGTDVVLVRLETRKETLITVNPEGGIKVRWPTHLDRPVAGSSQR